MVLLKFGPPPYVSFSEVGAHLQTNKQKNKQKNRQTDKQTNKQMNKQTEVRAPLYDDQSILF